MLVAKRQDLWRACKAHDNHHDMTCGLLIVMVAHGSNA